MIDSLVLQFWKTHNIAFDASQIHPKKIRGANE